MVQLYFSKILDGTITIDDVPRLWKSKVQAKLDEYYASMAEEESAEDNAMEKEAEKVSEVSEESTTEA